MSSLHLVGVAGGVGAVAEALGDVVAGLLIAVAGVHGLTGVRARRELGDRGGGAGIGRPRY